MKRKWVGSEAIEDTPPYSLKIGEDITVPVTFVDWIYCSALSNNSFSFCNNNNNLFLKKKAFCSF